MKVFFYKSSTFLLTFILIIYSRFYLSFFGFGKLVSLLKKSRRNLLNINKLGYVLKSIKLTCSVVPKISCLIRVSALKIIFGDTRGLIIYIGIRTNRSKKFESHAWAAYKDRVILNNDEVSSYETIYKI